MPSVSMRASRVDILGAYEGRRGVKNVCVQLDWEEADTARWGPGNESAIALMIRGTLTYR